MPLPYSSCRRLCAEAEHCEPILHAMEAYEEAYGHPPRMRTVTALGNGTPICFVRREKPHMATDAKPG